MSEQTKKIEVIIGYKSGKINPEEYLNVLKQYILSEVIHPETIYESETETRLYSGSKKVYRLKIVAEEL